jgi:hypothetical protein
MRVIIWIIKTNVGRRFPWGSCFHKLFPNEMPKKSGGDQMSPSAAKARSCSQPITYGL